MNRPRFFSPTFFALGALAGLACSDPAAPAGSGGAASSGGDSGATGGIGNPSGGTGGIVAGSGGATGVVGGSGGTTPNEPRSACKRGVAYGHHSKADLTLLSPKVSFWYNWTHRPDEAWQDGSYADLDVEYVPMVWGGSFSTETLVAEIPGDARVLLGFNEPNFGAQANLSAAAAAALWPQVEQIADARQLLIASPAVNYCGGDCQDTNPFDYLDDFFAACAGCRVDKVAFHVYVGCNTSGENRAQWLIDQVETYKTRFSEPLWLTEFACDDAGSFQDQIGFLEDAVAYLENEPRVERYAWFSGRFEHMQYVDLLGADGALTPLGQAYLDAPVNAACPD